ncbi:hypothetical protein D187_005667 [Cystobacter fuscus DSM 2262]|uniref:Uncharacterized protein n=1 Tax=Cystobacter fuscus (strain ATCC 25194 / DSM 2262 / NBRC 100088 / M29) TaxID=1242864 RepID=S9PJM1_CYSF2|nr:hypothetical protein D187_005667 [Cystobacter fuscus DSM 2262]
MRILLLLGTAAVGETAALVSGAPKLPGFAKAAGSLKTHAGIRDVLTAVQEADKVKVVVAEGTFSVVLPANALAMTVNGPPKSEHARQRQMEGRPVGMAFNDARTARPVDVFIQSENDRFVVRGPNGREHIKDASTAIGLGSVWPWRCTSRILARRRGRLPARCSGG